MKQRHVFRVNPPEGSVKLSNLQGYAMLNDSPEIPNIFIDVQIYNGEKTIIDWGCIVDGFQFKPVWVTDDVLNAELKRIRIK